MYGIESVGLLASAGFLLVLGLLGCTTAVTPAPTPTATPDILATVRAAVAEEEVNFGPVL